MKRILITGSGSYIGTSFARWAEGKSPDIHTETLDMRDKTWRQASFRGYDAVFHVAGIAHADVGRATEEEKRLYYQVNTDLAVECAAKAKAEGVRQFIFMSSIIVYGESAGIGRRRMITRDTPLSPANFYGDSKAKAEEGLAGLRDGSFRVVILRPPMIYGPGSKGNYPILSRLARRLPAFPDVRNERSMLYVGNLCRFVSLMILNDEDGVFFPQNAEYVETSRMVHRIAQAHGKRILLTRALNPLLRMLGRLGGRIGRLVDKAFGSIVYEKDMSVYKDDYQEYGFEESVRLTEGGA